VVRLVGKREKVCKGRGNMLPGIAKINLLVLEVFETD